MAIVYVCNVLVYAFIHTVFPDVKCRTNSKNLHLAYLLLFKFSILNAAIASSEYDLILIKVSIPKKN